MMMAREFYGVMPWTRFLNETPIMPSAAHRWARILKSVHPMSPRLDEVTMRVLRPLDGGVVYHRQKVAAGVDTQRQPFLRVSRMHKRVKIYNHSY
ncbi:hypothetical protein Q1695_001176 [Nippostrongylus brasiliensis]|nr:hypothetical protein Q1695_001176 [Nippostrongylus brasiliensis]